ncbi:hypothetical protein Tco_1301801 [Tanacetum coccineum]
MARKSISQTEQQECKLAENANNKRKWEGNHNGQCTVKFGNCKKVDHMTQDLKFQKRVDKKISTLAKRQTENKRKFENTSRNSQNQQQQQIKRQNTGRAYTAGSGDKKPYGGSRPLAQSAITTMTVRVLQSAINATNMVTSPVTVGVREMPMLLTTKGSLWQVRRLFAMNVGIKGTTRGIAQSERTKVIKTKLEVLEHMDWCIP